MPSDAPDPPRERTGPSDLTLLRGQVLYKALAESGFADPRLAKVKEDIVAQILADVPLFAGLDTGARRAVADAAQICEVSGGQVIVRARTSSEAFYVLLTGSASVHRPGGDPTTLRRGDHFGELGLLEETPRTATVTADRELWLLRISRTAFASLLRREPQIGELLRASTRTGAASNRSDPGGPSR